ncbi:MAG: S41 family peptidase [Candidatus Dadabacteria bacterium]
MRAITLIFLLLIFSCARAQTKYQKDFNYYWTTINDNFAYFDIQKTNWNQVKAIYQPVVDTITTTSSFIQLLENINNELYNGHITLNTNLPSSNRIIPTGADLWITYKGNEYIINSTREGLGAEQSGLRQGMRITHFNGQPIERAVQEFLPKSVSVHDERMYEYAANMLLAGRHNTTRIITALSNGLEKEYYPDTFVNMDHFKYTQILEFKRLPHDLGYIKVNNSLGDDALIKAFDDALNKLWNTKGLVIDLRETPSGGNTTVARAIMSRFIEKEMGYQKHSLPGEEKQYGIKRSWIELVSPRGKIYKKPLVILVNRWTGSMGEGIAIGLDGMKRAVIVGDRMAGLLGANYSFTLPETNIGFSFPAEKLFDINGTPRENFVPKYLVIKNQDYLPLATKLLTGKSTATKKALHNK